MTYRYRRTLCLIQRHVSWIRIRMALVIRLIWILIMMESQILTKGPAVLTHLQIMTAITFRTTLIQISHLILIPTATVSTIILILTWMQFQTFWTSTPTMMALPIASKPAGTTLIKMASLMALQTQMPMVYPMRWERAWCRGILMAIHDIRSKTATQTAMVSRTALKLQEQTRI